MEVDKLAVLSVVFEDPPAFDLRGRRTGGSEAEVSDREAGAFVASSSLSAGQPTVKVISQVTQRPRLTS